MRRVAFLAPELPNMTSTNLIPTPILESILKDFIILSNDLTIIQYLSKFEVLTENSPISEKQKCKIFLDILKSTGFVNRTVDVYDKYYRVRSLIVRIFP